METRVQEARRVRDHARAAGDRNLERAMTADLERLGVFDEPGQEIAVPRPPERAVPRAKRAGARTPSR